MKQALLPRFLTVRVGQPEDAAHLIAFLASKDAGWITGQIIRSTRAVALARALQR